MGLGASCPTCRGTKASAACLSVRVSATVRLSGSRVIAVPAGAMELPSPL